MPAKSINLLPHKDFDKTPVGKLLLWSLTYGRYIIVCTEIIVLLAFVFRFSLDRKITDLNEEVEQKSAIIEANLGFERQFRNLQFRADQIGELIADHNATVTLIRHLEDLTPQGVVFSKLSFDGSIVSINARTNTNNSLALFLNNLRSSNLLTNIKVENVSSRATGVSETSFLLEATFKAPPDGEQIL